MSNQYLRGSELFLILNQANKQTAEEYNICKDLWYINCSDAEYKLTILIDANPHLADRLRQWGATWGIKPCDKARWTRKLAAVTLDGDPVIINVNSNECFNAVKNFGKPLAVAYDMLFATELCTGVNIWTGTGYVIDQKFIANAVEGRHNYDCIAAIVEAVNAGDHQ